MTIVQTIVRKAHGGTLTLNYTAEMQTAEARRDQINQEMNRKLAWGARP